MESRAIEDGAHILLVEDDDMILAVASTMLEHLGFAVDSYDNGKDAVNRYRDDWRDFDLVILDVIMPEMDGEETFDALHQINPGLKVLVSSGYNLDDKTQRILQKGASGYIQKPYRREELSLKISDALGAAPSPR